MKLPNLTKTPPSILKWALLISFLSWILFFVLYLKSQLDWDMSLEVVVATVLFSAISLVILIIDIIVWKVILGHGSDFKKVLFTSLSILVTFLFLSFALNEVGVPKLSHPDYIINTPIQKIETQGKVISYSTEIRPHRTIVSVQDTLILQDDKVHRILLPIHDANELLNIPIPWGQLSFESGDKYQLVVFGISKRWIFEIDLVNDTAKMIKIIPLGSISCQDKTTGEYYFCPIGK